MASLWSVARPYNCTCSGETRTPGQVLNTRTVSGRWIAPGVAASKGHHFVLGDTGMARQHRYRRLG